MARDRLRLGIRLVDGWPSTISAPAAEIADLSKAAAILRWDQQTMMPPRGAAVRAEQLATLGRIAHDRFTDPEVGRLLDELVGFEAQHEYDSFEASLVRVTRRDWEKERRVPSELRAGDVARIHARVPGVGRRAAANDFAASCRCCARTSSSRGATSSASMITTSRTTSYWMTTSPG